MAKPVLYYLSCIFFLIISRLSFPEFIQSCTAYSNDIQQNPSDKRMLLNGRIWRNQYSKAVGDQFFLTNSFLNGTVTFDGRKFDNLDLQFDIVNDELILKIESYPIIIMNKEMVDSFSLASGNRIYHIFNAGNDSSGALKGYVNVLYDGPSALYVKYTKKIQPLAVDGRYDLFLAEHRTYLRKGAELVSVKSRKKLLNILENRKKEIRHFLRTNRIKLSGKDPDTFVPVLKYYDSIRE
jgi:hypothetical protein